MTTLTLILILLGICIVESVLFTLSVKTYNVFLKIVGIVAFIAIIVLAAFFFYKQGYIMI